MTTNQVVKLLDNHNRFGSFDQFQDAYEPCMECNDEFPPKEIEDNGGYCDTCVKIYAITDTKADQIADWPIDPSYSPELLALYDALGNLDRQTPPDPPDPNYDDLAEEYGRQLKTRQARHDMLNRIVIAFLGILAIAVLLLTIHFSQQPQAFSPRCIRLESGQTVWLTDIDQDGRLVYRGAECLPNVGLLTDDEA